MVDPVNKIESDKYYGFYRAKVVNNRDESKFGRVLLWIPDIMPLISDKEGIWARPGNNPIGGRNIEDDKENYYTGASYIPKTGSWVWVFFENGNINRPYYWGALDIENTKTLPEVQQGEKFQHKWVIFRSHAGRCIVVSDDLGVDERIEITGKKRKMDNPPSGDEDSVYKIDGNMNTILLDEVKGREKFLIRTRFGDYIHVDIEERELQCYFKNDIKIQTDGNFHLKVKDNIRIEAGINTYLTVGGDIHRKSKNFYSYASSQTHHVSGIGDWQSTGSVISSQTGGEYLVDSGIEQKEIGASYPALMADPAEPKTPLGYRAS